MSTITRAEREALAVVEEVQRSNQPAPPTKSYLLRENFIFTGATIGGAIGYLAGILPNIASALETGGVGKAIEVLPTVLGSTGPIAAVVGLVSGAAFGYLAYRTYSFTRKIHSGS